MREMTIPLALAALLGLGACTIGPDYEQPDSELPETWQSQVLDQAEDTRDWSAWWQRYQDPTLTRLVERALSQNLDIQAQAARIRQARAQLGLSRAEQYPTVDLQADASRQRSSEEAATASGGRTYNTFSIAGALNYEVDLWGRVERETESARAALFQSVFTQETIRLTTVADVVATYYNLRGAERKLQIAENTVQSRRETLELQRTRLQAGDIASLPVQQAQAELETTRSAIPPLKEQIRQYRTALAILVGGTPREIVQEIELSGPGLEEARVPTRMPEVLPSEMLERRPDIRAAEATLVAANADLGAAKTQWYPSINLSALLGVEATEVDNLFTGGARTWSVGGSLLQPLLHFNRIQANVDGAEAARELATINYQQTLRTAFQEVEDALTALTSANERLAARRRQVRALEETLELAQRRYEGGFTSFIDVLDAQRNLFDAQISLTEAERDRLTAVATLYKALGGGWTDTSDLTTAQAERESGGS